jgi:hypothetical protein
VQVQGKAQWDNTGVHCRRATLEKDLSRSKPRAQCDAVPSPERSNPKAGTAKPSPVMAAGISDARGHES